MINDKKKIIINFGGRRIKTRRDALLCNLRGGNRGYKGGGEKMVQKGKKETRRQNHAHFSESESEKIGGGCENP